MEARLLFTSILHLTDEVKYSYTDQFGLAFQEGCDFMIRKIDPNLQLVLDSLMTELRKLKDGIEVSTAQLVLQTESAVNYDDMFELDIRLRELAGREHIRLVEAVAGSSDSCLPFNINYVVKRT